VTRETNTQKSLHATPFLSEKGYKQEGGGGRARGITTTTKTKAVVSPASAYFPTASIISANMFNKLKSVLAWGGTIWAGGRGVGVIRRDRTKPQKNERERERARVMYSM